MIDFITRWRPDDFLGLSKKELRSRLAEAKNLSEDRDAAFAKLKREKEEVQRIREKNGLIIQAARAAFEDLRRALYPDTYATKPLEPNRLRSPNLPPYVINNRV